jgi:Flp pilus assembly protein TadD/lauroyl/myristoyl acyltransferase
MISFNHSTCPSLSQLLVAKDWAELNRLYSRRQDKGAVLTAEHKVRWALARLHLGEPLSAVEGWLPNVVTDEKMRSLLIRYGVTPLQEAGNLALASELMARIQSGGENRILDGLKRLSLLMKTRQWAQASVLAWQLRGEAPGDLSVGQALLRLLIRTRQHAQALEVARQYLDQVQDWSWAALLLPLMGRSSQALERQWALDFVQGLREVPPKWAATVMQVYADFGLDDKVIDIGEHALKEGQSDIGLHRLMARSIQNRSPVESARRDALPYWLNAYEQHPDSEVIAASLADVLVRLGRNDQAIVVLERLLQDSKKRWYLHALYARVLRHVHRYDEACAQYKLLHEAQPRSAKWPRYLASCLLLAGRRLEAERVFGLNVEERRDRLPLDFNKGLQALSQKISATPIPKARLDWAWSLRDPRCQLDRSEWEQKAIWGHLADHYILDWLECRPELAEQAMQYLANLDKADEFFGEQLPARGPWILATAHVGPMYAGPLALALLGKNMKWLASTPGLLAGSYSESLISTTGMTELEVVRQSLTALQRGQGLVVALDGSVNLAAPTVEFLGQRITYSSLCARLAYKLHLPTAFVAPKWKGHEIDFWMERLPDPYVGESVGDYMQRWQAAYLEQLADYLRENPENLRLSGGLWRHIR